MAWDTTEARHPLEIIKQENKQASKECSSRHMLWLCSAQKLFCLSFLNYPAVFAFKANQTHTGYLLPSNLVLPVPSSHWF